MSDISSIIEKVKKLLALSKSTNANEAATAASAANRLIDQYRLSEADVDDESTIHDVLEEDEEFVYESKSVTPWKHDLIMNLARHYGLAVINHQQQTYNVNYRGRIRSRFRFIGRRNDIQVAKYMYAWLSSECVRLSTTEARGRGRVYVSSWCHGFVSGVNEKLKSSREEAKREASTNAIVKIDARQQQSIDFMRRSYSNLRDSQHTSNARLDGTAWRRGREQGRSLHVGDALSDGNKKVKELT